MADVFISYSRRDSEFVSALHHALKEQHYETWIDWEGIPPTAEFLQEIYLAIEAADTFVFIMSPDSVISGVCTLEIAHAVKHNKRLVPILHRDVDNQTVPEALATINWVFLRKSDDFKSAFQTLMDAINTDLDWVHEHTRLLTRAIEWDHKNRNKSFVLRGRDLQAAKHWRVQGPEKNPKPTSLQTQYIIASRKAATNRQTFVLLLPLVWR